MGNSTSDLVSVENRYITVKYSHESEEYLERRGFSSTYCKYTFLRTYTIPNGYTIEPYEGLYLIRDPTGTVKYEYEAGYDHSGPLVTLKEV